MSARLEPEPVAVGSWRLPLPSKTLPPFDHTNSYLVKRGEEAVLIDAGSNDPAVLDTLVATLEGLEIIQPKGVLLTHTHPDHCAGAAALSARYGVKVYVHAREQDRLGFPAELLADGEMFPLGGERIGVHHTPGHSPGHLSFSLLDTPTNTLTVFVGDLLTAQGSTWVGLPEGSVSDYLASLEKLTALLTQSPGGAVFGPGHGPLVRNPAVRLEQVRAHRLAREAEILAALTRPLSLQMLKRRVYPKVPDTLTPMTEGALLAHLEKLIREGRVVQTDDQEAGATWVALKSP